MNEIWVDALDEETYEDLNPYTGEAFAKVASGERTDAKPAIDAAVAAFPPGLADLRPSVNLF